MAFSSHCLQFKICNHYHEWVKDCQLSLCTGKLLCPIPRYLLHELEQTMEHYCSPPSRSVILTSDAIVDSSVGIANCYGLVGPGIECRWGRDLPHPSKPALEPTQLPIQWVPALFPRGVALTTHPPSSAEVKERVELYLCSPSGPSWPVLG